ncbi:MAG: carboxypeptidase regulatory-like domain-containing protein [Paludibacteraceae bacterium]|nr:carboxypeptidase regulatory-like domain-containing protein [Paludibacteraceae bacterium]
MKKSLYLLLGLLLVCGIYQACAPEELPGSIYGTVVDKATGEPIKSAGVELSPVGLKTVTGSEGQFEFTELDPGKYTLLVTKTGYMAGVSHTIEVKPGQQAKGDLQIERMPPALKVVDGNRKEISTLDFGSSIDDVSRSFSLFNDGSEKIEWQITANAKWITSVSKTEGTLSAGATQSLLITIDRTLLNSGENKTTVHITSNSGNKQLIVVATNSFSPVTLNTFAITNISNSSATFHGEIIEIGTPKYTERGFVYSKSSMPTINTTIKKITSPVTDYDSYEENVSGLVEGSTYYVRAYAVNGGKTAYSTNEVSFVAEKYTINAPTVTTSSATNITTSSATIGGNVTSDGGATVTERGVCYSTSSSNPTTSNSKKSSGSGLGNFTVNLSNLSAGTKYYVRAYAINEIGTSYGLTISFTTEEPTYSKPTVTTSSATYVTTSSATIGGNVTSDGGTTVTERGVCYSTSSSTPTTSNSKKTAGSGLGNFTVNLSNLSAGTKYYVRAYAINEVGTSYGSTISFTTEEEPSYSKPTVTTSSATNVTTSSATIGGNVTSDGGTTVTERGVCYSTSSSNPTTSNSKKSSGSGLGNFTVNLSNLSAGTKYYVRAYAINEIGTSYGSTISFTTEQSSSTSNTENGHQYVDLGLSVKWATCNVGTTKPEGYGDYFAWGETRSKSYYNSSSYSYYDNPTTLPLSADAARANWGGQWRMPTIDEFEELRNNCTWKWTTQNGVNGYKVTSNSNGNYIFLPAAGYRDLGSLYGAGDYGYYWSSSAYGPNYSTTALYLYFYSTWKDRKNDYKAAGRSVRPVCP